MADNAVAVPLAELGAPMVASRGRLNADGTPFFRSVVDLFPEVLASREIVFAGTQIATDFEALAAAQPDLIIGRIWDESEVDQLSAIAPVLLFDDSEDGFAFYRRIADAVGRLPVFNALLESYQRTVETNRILLGEHDFTFQNAQFSGSPTFAVCGRYGALGQALFDLNFTIIGRSAEIDARGGAFCEEVSAEVIVELDADFIFDSYRTDIEPSDPLNALERINGTLRGACKLLTACAEGRVIYVPREYAFPVSFRSLSTMLQFIVSHVAGRPGTTPPG